MSNANLPPQPPEQPNQPEPIAHLDFETPVQSPDLEAEAIVAEENRKVRVENWGRIVRPKSPGELLAEMNKANQQPAPKDEKQPDNRPNPLTDPKNWGKRLPPDQMPPHE